VTQANNELNEISTLVLRIDPIKSSATLRIRLVVRSVSLVPFKGQKKQLSVTNRLLELDLDRERGRSFVLPGSVGLYEGFSIEIEELAALTKEGGEWAVVLTNASITLPLEVEIRPNRTTEIKLILEPDRLVLENARIDEVLSAGARIHGEEERFRLFGKEDTLELVSGHHLQKGGIKKFVLKAAPTAFRPGTELVLRRRDHEGLSDVSHSFQAMTGNAQYQRLPPNVGITSRAFAASSDFHLIPIVISRAA
jgi:hypothetical protein